MAEVVLSPSARQTMDRYFDNYVGSQWHNDMVIRAFNYSRILKCLSEINHFDTYVINGKNFVDINDICRVEYEINVAETQLVIQNIYFNKHQYFL